MIQVIITYRYTMPSIEEFETIEKALDFIEKYKDGMCSVLITKIED